MDALPRIQKLVSLQDIVIAASLGGKLTIVDYSPDEAGLYVSGLSNDFGTPLAARGPRVELEALAQELGRVHVQVEPDELDAELTSELTAGTESSGFDL